MHNLNKALTVEAAHPKLPPVAWSPAMSTAATGPQEVRGPALAPGSGPGEPQEQRHFPLPRSRRAFWFQGVAQPEGPHLAPDGSHLLSLNLRHNPPPTPLDNEGRDTHRREVRIDHRAAPLLGVRPRGWGPELVFGKSSPCPRPRSPHSAQGA